MITLIVVLLTYLYAIDHKTSVFGKIYFYRSKDWRNQLFTDIHGIIIIATASFAMNGLLISMMLNPMKNKYIKDVYMQIEPKSYESYQLTNSDVYTNELVDNNTYEDQVPVYVGFSYLKGDIIRDAYVKDDHVSIVHSNNPHVEIETYEYQLPNPLGMKLLLFPFDNLAECTIENRIKYSGYLTGYKIYVPEDQVNSSIRFLEMKHSN